MNSSTLQINPINASNRHRLIDDVLYSVPRSNPSDKAASERADVLRPARSRKRWAAARCSATFTQGYRRRGEPRSPPKKQMQRFVRRMCTGGDTHFESVTRNPGSRCRTADAGRRREKLRLSPYCRCSLSLPPPPQRERFPCITDDSQQKGRECRQATLLEIRKVTEACGPESPPFVMFFTTSGLAAQR